MLGREGGKEGGERTYLVDNHILDGRRPEQRGAVRALVRDDRHGVSIRQAKPKEGRGLVGDGTEPTTIGGAQHGGEQHLRHSNVGRLVIDGGGGGEGQRRAAGEGLVVVGVVLGLDVAVDDGPAVLGQSHGDSGGLAADGLGWGVEGREECEWGGLIGRVCAGGDASFGILPHGREREGGTSLFYPRLIWACEWSVSLPCVACVSLPLHPTLDPSLPSSR